MSSSTSDPAPARAAVVSDSLADMTVPAEWERHERAEHILANSGVGIRHVPGDRAFYRLSEDRITLPERGQFPSGDRFYATALHELGHATGHPSRLGRDIAHPFGSEGYAREELRAEIASMMLGEQLGVGHDPGQHVAYVASWIKVLEQDPREVFRAAADADRITKMVRSFEREQDREASEQPRVAAQQDQERQQDTPTVQARLPTSIRENHPAVSSTSDERTYLAVPYAEKDDAKQAGAKWDRAEKAWFVPPGVSLEGFAAWMPNRGTVQIDAGPDPRGEFATVLHQAGLRLPGEPMMDGKLHRVPVDGDKGKETSGVYKGHLDGRPAGFIQNHKTGFRTTWKASGAEIDAQARAQLAAEAAQKRHDRAHERERMYERTADQVAALWANSRPAGAHPYLSAKGVQAHELREDKAGHLLVPVQDGEGKLWSLQRIAPDGSKAFAAESRAEGGRYVLGDLRQPGPVLVAEGFATAATVHELTGLPVAVTFNAGNLGRVAADLRARFPDRPIHVAGDDDRARAAEGKPNVGREKAEEAARAVGGRALFPVFPMGVPGSDWNDLARAQGHEAAQLGLRVALRVAERHQTATGLTAARLDGRGTAPQLSRTPERERVRAVAEIER